MACYWWASILRLSAEISHPIYIGPRLMKLTFVNRSAERRTRLVLVSVRTTKIKQAKGGLFYFGGRYWTRTSDLTNVNRAL